MQSQIIKPTATHNEPRRVSIECRSESTVLRGVGVVGGIAKILSGSDPDVGVNIAWFNGMPDTSLLEKIVR